MKVLVGSVVYQKPAVFAAWLKCIGRQVVDADVDVMVLLDPSDPDHDENARIAEGLAVVEDAGPKPDGAAYGVTERSHQWQKPTFYWLAEQKQRILLYAATEGYDAVWLVDSDLVCEPMTLNSLLTTGKEVVSAVFWTRWTPQDPPLPQVWRAHPYEFQGAGWEAHEFLQSIVDRQITPVAGLGACTLIRADVLDRVWYWPLVPNLPEWGMWQGEDRHFCVTATRNHVGLWADPWPSVWHCYRPSDVEQLPFHVKRLLEPRPPMRPVPGDWVWFTVEPLEEPRMPGHVEHVRGRLGQVKLVPGLERLLSGMRAGDERIESIAMPYWHPLKEYKGQSKIVRVRMIDVRPNTGQPTLSEDEPDVANILQPFRDAV